MSMIKKRITIYPSKELKDLIQAEGSSNNRSMNNFLLGIIANHFNFKGTMEDPYTIGVEKDVNIIELTKEVQEENGTGPNTEQSDNRFSRYEDGRF